MSYFKSISPFSNEAFHLVDMLSKQETEATLEAAHNAFHLWRSTPLEERIALLHSCKTKLKERLPELAELASKEMGKPIRESRAEIQKCLSLFDYYASVSGEALHPEVEQDTNSKTIITKNPTGVLLGIMPWNFPYWQVFRFAIPNLILGNTLLIKHAPQTMGCSEEIHRIFSELPRGCFNHFPIRENEVEEIIADARVTGVSLTGSTKAGKAVGRLAGKHIKKSVMELGGNNAYLVMPSANLPLAVKKCMQGRFLNAGQSCIAAKRILLHPDIREAFLDLFLEKVDNLVLGDPLDESTQIGPMSRLELAEHLENQVQKTLEQGAELLVGGDRQGCFFPPTVLGGLTPNMHLGQEEGFGPVACLYFPENEDQLWEWAMDTKYGLGTAIFTQSDADVVKASETLIDSALFVNEIVKSDARLPFGGIRASGFGRELGRAAFHEFCNIKTTYIATTNPALT